MLAAGHSRRYGLSNKLLADFEQLPLIAHSAKTLSGLAVAQRVAVLGKDIDPQLVPGFVAVTPSGEDFQQSASLKSGLATIMQHPLDGVIICLADMPLVPLSHFEGLIAGWCDASSLVATHACGRPMPPALFGADWFGALMASEGDQGARQLIAKATHYIELGDQFAADVDSISDLALLQQSRAS